MNNLFILLQASTDAAKSAEEAGSGGSGWMSLLPLLLIIVVFWLFMIRPQSKKAKEERKFRENLQKGDKVVTIGGFHGKITEVKENTVMVSLAPNMEVELEKSAIIPNAANVGQA